MRDRLIELLKAAKKNRGMYSPEGYLMGATFNIPLVDDKYVELLADHLLAEGVIVPPCKVGDIVYAPHWHWGTYINGDIMPYQITNITITQNKKGVLTKKYRAMEVQNGKTIDWQFNFGFDAIGESVFLTREEAEKALERSENGT